MSTRKTREEWAASYARLRKETVSPVREFTASLRASEPTVIRYVTRGRPVNGRRVYLDGLRLPRRGWVSSVEAVVRFLNACEEAAGEKLRA